VQGDLADEERLVQRYALELTSQHSIGAYLYEEMERTFGRRGKVDIAYSAL
jgi:hypothetical protein